jgi:uncharacterized protein YodC (DUF2158 family)
MFKLSEPVVLSLSGERGVIAGRCEYEDGSVRYSVRYLRRTLDGETQCEGWFNEPDLKPVAIDLQEGLKAPREVCETACSDWQLGSVALLQSSGPKMTIEAIDGPTATCSWFIDGRLERAVFPVCALRRM